MPTATIVKATATGLLAAVLAGCTGDRPDPPPTASSAPPAPSSPASPTVPPAQAAAAERVLDQYRRFNQAYVAAGETADYKNEELVGYLESPLKQKVVAFLLQMSQKNLIYRGKPTSEPTVTAINLSAKPQTAVIDDCYDATNYVLVYKATGKPAPIPSGSRRYILQTTATNFGGSRGWLFTKSQGFPERSC